MAEPGRTAFKAWDGLPEARYRAPPTLGGFISRIASGPALDQRGDTPATGRCLGAPAHRRVRESTREWPTRERHQRLIPEGEALLTKVIAWRLELLETRCKHPGHDEGSHDATRRHEDAT